MRLFIFCLILSLMGCATPVAYDFDSSVNFSALKTYAFMPDAPSSGDPLIDSDTLLHQRVMEALDREFTVKGYRKVSPQESDFWLNYKVLSRRKLDVYSNYGYGGGFGFRRYPFSYQADMMTIREYDESTLVLDIIDPRSRKLYWRAIVRNYLSEEDSPGEKALKINQQVKAMLQGFPPH